MAFSPQKLRLRKPVAVPPTTSHAGILPDHPRPLARRIWTPSFSFAVRVLLLVRVHGAMYSNIQDCDEVFNFWEPLHLADRGYGFQTWEVSPQFAIRSWAYILLFLMPAKTTALFLGPKKRPAFFAIRILLGVISTLCEAKLYRAVVEKVSERIGRYLFFMLLGSAGMWNAATALLPSSFAMYTTTLAFAYSCEPPSMNTGHRTLLTTLLFATGAIVGWPFALALAIPFVLEELLASGRDSVPSDTRLSWRIARLKRLFYAGLVALLLFIPVTAIDSWVYGRLVFVPWNIIRYNIFGGPARGSHLFGTSPWNFYILNLVLNFNVLVPLALLSLPAVAVTYQFDRKRLTASKSAPGWSSPSTSLTIKLAPMYIWIGILTAQPHKEERFMYPVYPILCFNAAVTLYLMRVWLQDIYIYMTKSPYKASKSSLFGTLTSSIVVGSGLLSLSRILALWKYYHAPMTVFYIFETQELPRLNATGLPPVAIDDHVRADLSHIKQLDLRLCLGKEWHRFPGHYLVPDGIRVDFMKSEFDGLLPGHFQAVPINDNAWWLFNTVSVQPEGLNDINKEEPSHYIPISDCDYLVDLDFPIHPVSSQFEPRYAVDNSTWERVFCAPFLDARHSSLLTRTLWMPGETWQKFNSFGDYCLLKNRRSVERKVQDTVR